MSGRYFHFTVGPVQGFVAQARRTRDFWAGSFLLSWLAAVAMKAVEQQKGEIIFPKINNDYLDWLANGTGNGSAPQQGCVPNRFKGGLAKVPGDFKPEWVVQSIQQAWEGLAEAVWQHDLQGSPALSRAIWERQVGCFWEISWALTDQESESNLLDRRKNWRTYLPSAEAGVKCMMMDGWQELSGIATPNAQGLELFWRSLREKSSSLASDLREHEYLCAIAFIKRRFSHVFQSLSVEMPGCQWRAHGWEVSSSVPSVAYVAAAPWLAEVIRHAPEAELRNFHDAAYDLTRSYGEYRSQLRCIKEALLGRTDRGVCWRTQNLDGNVFFEAALDNKNIYADQVKATRTKKALIKLRQSINDAALDPVSPFYAVLMMDGDSLGSHMSVKEKQENISKALDDFTQDVPRIVEKRSGFLVYAGGDDVLALLPLEFALQCALELRQLYLSCFAAYPDINTTLSGAIEYAHIKMPLGKVLGDAHRLLDDVAKDQTGRDAIAVRVWKPGGQHLQWAMPWEKAIAENKVVIQHLADDFRKTEQETPFSNKFFFNIDQRFALLQDHTGQDNQDGFGIDTLVQLIAAEYLNSGVNVKRDKRLTIAEAKALIDPFIKQCQRIIRIVDDSDVHFAVSPSLNTDAAQLVRFLAQKGVQHG